MEYANCVILLNNEEQNDVNINVFKIQIHSKDISS